MKYRRYVILSIVSLYRSILLLIAGKQIRLPYYVKPIPICNCISGGLCIMLLHNNPFFFFFFTFFNVRVPCPRGFLVSQPAAR